jgi:hypothetical protein
MIILVFLAIIIIALAVYFGTNKKDNDSSKQSNKLKKIKKMEKAMKDSNYITPDKFDVGVITDPEKKVVSSSLCNKNVLFPLTQPNVDYGSKYPDNCPCLQFVQSP